MLEFEITRNNYKYWWYLTLDQIWTCCFSIASFSAALQIDTRSFHGTNPKLNSRIKTAVSWINSPWRHGETNTIITQFQISPQTIRAGAGLIWFALPPSFHWMLWGNFRGLWAAVRPRSETPANRFVPMEKLGTRWLWEEW